MRAAAPGEEGDSAPRCGGPRNSLSRKSSPLFLSLALFPYLSAVPFSLSLLSSFSASGLTFSVLLLPLIPSALFRSPFVTVTTPLVLLTESSPPPRCWLEYRNRSVGAKGHGGKRGLVRNTGGGEGCAGYGGVMVAGLVVEVRRASSIKIIFQRALPPARYHPEISAL